MKNESNLVPIWEKANLTLTEAAAYSNIGITMNVYTRASYAKAEESMQKILQFKPQDKEQKTG